MKTKLLRKVRKRYEILWYPKGTVSGKKPFYLLRDVQSWNSLMDGYLREFIINIGDGKHDCPTKESAYTLILNKLSKWILIDYAYAGKRRNNLHKPIKVWHKEVLNNTGKK